MEKAKTSQTKNPWDKNTDTRCTPFTSPTAYIALDTIKVMREHNWEKQQYEIGCSYVVGRDVPQKVARTMIKEGKARLGPTVWENQTGYEYRVECIKDIDAIHVDAKSTTDFYTTPRITWWLYPPTGIGRKAAHVHDVLVQKGKKVRCRKKNGELIECARPVSSKEAALIFNEAMAVALVPAIERRIKYYAVRWFGPRFSRKE